jgi:glycerophosphoryl diester phosphodiesterase
LHRQLHPFLDWDGPLAFAHRGGACDEPENTLPAFAHAVRLGYTYLETDAHVSIDGVVFAFHDDVLERVTDREGRISELRAAAIEEADAGYTFSRNGGGSFPRRGHGIRVPRLATILEEWRDVRVNIDAKSDEVVGPLVALIQRMNVHDRVCVGSFSDARLARVRRLTGRRVCTSMGPKAISRARVASWASGLIPRQGADALQIPVRSGRVKLAEPRLVRAAHRSGLHVHVWTIDEAAEMHRLLDIGVDGIMTDRPKVLREVLESRGQWK